MTGGLLRILRREFFVHTSFVSLASRVATTGVDSSPPPLACGCCNAPRVPPHLGGGAPRGGLAGGRGSRRRGIGRRCRRSCGGCRCRRRRGRRWWWRRQSAHRHRRQRCNCLPQRRQAAREPRRHVLIQRRLQRQPPRHVHMQRRPGGDVCQPEGPILQADQPVDGQREVLQHAADLPVLHSIKTLS